MKRWFSSSIVIAALVLTSCGQPAVQVLEVESKTVSSTETIHMNNCGGKESSEQTAQRSFATGLELTSQSKVDYSVVEDRVSGKYGADKDMNKSQLLKAPPGTNMEFVLQWTEDVHSGDIIQREKIGGYTVHVPVSVELVSSQDLGCVSVNSDSRVKETLTVYFKDGATGVATKNEYSGPVSVLIQGTGQASNMQKSDAFYVFTDFNGENAEPMRYKEFYNFTLWINGEPADTLVNPIPPYNADHVYEFTIKAPGGKLVFAVGDVYVADNDGYYTIQIFK